MLNNKTVVALLLFLSCFAQARVGFEYSRDLSATAKTNNLSLSYALDAFTDDETGVVGFSNRLQYDFSNTLANVNLNSSLPDFEITSVSHQIAYDLIFSEALTLALKYNVTIFNTDVAEQDLASVGLYYRGRNYQIGYATSNADTRQLLDVNVLSVNRKNNVKFNRKSDSYYLGYNWTRSLMTSVNYTEYSYDKNLDGMYTLLTTLPFLNAGTAAVANEVGSQLKNSFDFNVSYALDANWMLMVSLGTAEEYLSPNTKSNNGSFGVEYEGELDHLTYRFFALLDVAKTVDVEGTSNSGQIGFGVNF